MLTRSAIIGVLFAAVLRQDTQTIDKVGAVVLALGALALLALATRSVRRSADRDMADAAPRASAEAMRA